MRATRRSAFPIRVRAVALASSAALAAGCADSIAPPASPTAAAQPAVGIVTVVPDTANALAVSVVFTVRNADSARVLYRAGPDAEQATPSVAVRDSARIPIFGLPAGVAVTARVVAMRGARRDTSAVVTGPVSAVPDVVGRVRLQATSGAPSAGYVFTGVSLGDTAYAVAFDTSGRVAWYHAFPGGGSALDAYQQPNGNITVFVGRPRPDDPAGGYDGYYAEVRTTGQIVREWRAPAGYYTDPHELLLGSAGAPSYVLAYDLVATDLTSRGGAADAPVAGHTLFRLDASGTATPVFRARDHFGVADWIDPQPGVDDLDHPNSIDVAPDGGLIVSWRNLDEVSKIDPATGQFVWRLGGRHNEFTFVNDPLNGFGGQHFARLLPNGNLLLYDNGTTHAPQLSRAVEYRLDLAAHTATLVWESRHQPAIYTPFVGSAQRLAGGNTFIGYSYNGVVSEVTPSGAVAYEGQLTVDGQVVAAYRMLKFAAIGSARP